MGPRRRLRPLVLGLVLVAAVCGAGRGEAATTERDAAVRRVLTLVRAVAEEYREAVDAQGRVVRPIEIEEARLFLVEARELGDRLGPPAAEGLATRFERVAAALEAGPLARVETEVDAFCGALVAATGVAEEFLPPAPPSATAGAAVYGTHCVSCHGTSGAGDGPEAARLDVRPADFTDVGFMRGETPADFFHVVSVGRRLAAMPAWDGALSVQERWDVVAHVWSLHAPAAERVEGQGLFVAHCAGCHGAAADGRGPFAGAVSVPDLGAPGALARRTDADLFATVTQGVAGTAMPGFGRTLSDAERWRVVAHLRALSLGAAAPARAAGAPSGAAERPAGAAFAEVRRLLAEAAAAHRRGDERAVGLATDAYFAFEPLEPRLRARDPAAVTRVEEAFLALRAALRQPGADVAPLVAAIEVGLDTAEAALASRAGGWALFLQSAAIILREGFEVVLIIGALLAWVVKSDNGHMRRPIWGGTLLGLVASVGTAGLLVTVLRRMPGMGELLEGVAMLLAAVVLFWVSYWIVSKAEAERWHRYIQGKVRRALAAGSGTALAAAAFLAVYREGFETVLFYQALVGTAPAGDVAVPAGFVAGVLVLAVVAVALRRFGMQVPIRPFFLTTGALLTAMAISFAGRGVQELQEAGVCATTAVPGVPSVPLLGLFPTVETLLAQGVLVALVAGGLVVTWMRARVAAATAEVRAELGRLREQADAMRAELAAAREAGDADAARGLDRRLAGLVQRVDELESRLPGNGRP